MNGRERTGHGRQGPRMSASLRKAFDEAEEMLEGHGIIDRLEAVGVSEGEIDAFIERVQGSSLAEPPGAIALDIMASVALEDEATRNLLEAMEGIEDSEMVIASLLRTAVTTALLEGFVLGVVYCVEARQAARQARQGRPRR